MHSWRNISLLLIVDVDHVDVDHVDVDHVDVDHEQIIVLNLYKNSRSPITAIKMWQVQTFFKKYYLMEQVKVVSRIYINPFVTGKTVCMFIRATNTKKII